MLYGRRETGAPQQLVNSSLTKITTLKSRCAMIFSGNSFARNMLWKLYGVHFTEFCMRYIQINRTRRSFFGFAEVSLCDVRYGRAAISSLTGTTGKVAGKFNICMHPRHNLHFHLRGILYSCASCKVQKLLNSVINSLSPTQITFLNKLSGMSQMELCRRQNLNYYSKI